MASVTRLCEQVQEADDWTWCGVGPQKAWLATFSGCLKTAPQTEDFDAARYPLMLVTTTEGLFVAGRFYRIDVTDVGPP
jgi:hypothetical protein